jgi:hypothetical protein
MKKILFAIIIVLSLMVAPAFAVGPPGSGTGAGWVKKADCSTVIADGAGCVVTGTGALYVGNGAAAVAVGGGAQGPAGADGCTLLNGAADPVAQGKVCDYYYNYTDKKIFGPKAGGGWPAGVSLVGPQGAQGPQGIQGAQGPAGTGDFLADGTVPMTGKLTGVQSAAGASGYASIRLPHGAAPTTNITNGDCWTTTAGLYCRINGATVGPYSINMVPNAAINSVYVTDGSTANVMTSIAGGGTTGILGWNASGVLGKYTTIQLDDSAAQFKSATASKGDVKIDVTGVDNTKHASIKPVCTADCEITTPSLSGNAVLGLQNADTTGSAGSVKSPSTTGKTTITGPSTGQTRNKNVSDNDATFIEGGTGYTVITEEVFIPVAWMIDGAAAPAALADLASTRKVKIRDFDGAANKDLEFMWDVPANYVGGVKFLVIGYVSAATAPGDTDVVAFSLAGCSIGNSDALGCTLGTAQTSSLTVSGTGYAQYDRLATAYSSEITVTDIAAGESAHFKLTRLATTTDTYAQLFGVAGIRIKYQAKILLGSDY